MTLVQQIIIYLFPTLLALAILYFAFGIVTIKYIKDYKKIKDGKEHIFNALTAIFWILVIWAVVHSVVALIS